MTEPHRYAVGEPYIPGRTRWPELAEYNYRQGTHELRLFLRRLSTDDVQAVRTGSAAFALVEERPVVLLLYRFGRRVPWSDAPFSLHLVPEEQRSLPPPLSGEQRATLQVVLVDADTGLIRALRLLSFTPAFSRALHGAIMRQAESSFDPAVFDATLASLYAQYPTTEALLPHAIARSP